MPSPDRLRTNISAMKAGTPSGQTKIMIAANVRAAWCSAEPYSIERSLATKVIDVPSPPSKLRETKVEKTVEVTAG